MAPLKGMDESWFGEGGEDENGEVERTRMSVKAEQEVLRRQAGGELGSDEEEEEEEYSGCCFLRGRSMSRRLSASGSDVKGGPFARLSTEDPEGIKVKVNNKFQRSRSVCATVFFCCGLSQEQMRSHYTTTTVEVRAVDGAKQNRKWEVDVEEDYVKPPYWKHLVRKVRAQCRPRVHKASGPEWLNYDPHSYQMNFDDGCWRENFASFLYAGENDDSASRERAMHGALVKKFATARTTSQQPSITTPDHLSPLPVKMVSKEEIERSKEGFVPIWQRRQGSAPPIKLDLRQRSNPIDD